MATTHTIFLKKRQGNWPVNLTGTLSGIGIVVFMERHTLVALEWTDGLVGNI